MPRISHGAGPGNIMDRLNDNIANREDKALIKNVLVLEPNILQGGGQHLRVEVSDAQDRHSQGVQACEASQPDCLEVKLIC